MEEAAAERVRARASDLEAQAAPEMSHPVRASGFGEFARLLREPRFRALFLAHFVSNLGDWLVFLALFSLAALEWHAGPLAVSLISVAYVLPMATVAFVAGVFVDRWDLRRVLVWSDLLRCGLVLLMATTDHMALLCMLLFLHQTVSCFFNPAQSAAMPRLLPKQDLLAANALTTQASHLTKLLGPGIAGLLVAAVGPRSCFYADAASFALSAVLLATLPRLPANAAATRGVGAVWHELTAGLRFLGRPGLVRRMVFLVAVSMAALGAFIAVLPVFARDELGAGSGLMGLLLSTMGCGTIAGAFAVVHGAHRWKGARPVVTGLFGMGAALLLLGLTLGTHLALAAAFLLGASTAATLVPAEAMVQQITPRSILGRVQSSAVATISLAQIASMAAAGPLADHFGVRTLFSRVAILPLLAGCAMLMLSVRTSRRARVLAASRVAAADARRTSR